MIILYIEMWNPTFTETGRYTITTLENRQCEFCEKNIMEDEKHFI